MKHKRKLLEHQTVICAHRFALCWVQIFFSFFSSPFFQLQYSMLNTKIYECTYAFRCFTIIHLICINLEASKVFLFISLFALLESSCRIRQHICMCVFSFDKTKPKPRKRKRFASRKTIFTTRFGCFMFVWSFLFFTGSSVFEKQHQQKNI